LVSNRLKVYEFDRIRSELAVTPQSVPKSLQMDTITKWKFRKWKWKYFHGNGNISRADHFHFRFYFHFHFLWSKYNIALICQCCDLRRRPISPSRGSTPGWIRPASESCGYRIRRPTNCRSDIIFSVSFMKLDLLFEKARTPREAHRRAAKEVTQHASCIAVSFESEHHGELSWDPSIMWLVDVSK